MNAEVIDTVKEGKYSLTVLLPVHNEADTISHTLEEIRQKILSKISSKLLIIEDGSTDNTKEVLRKLSKTFPMKLIMRRERLGYSRAVAFGLSIVDTKYVLFMDSDGQYYPEDFWVLWEVFNKENCDIVSGVRVKRADRLHRKIMSLTFQFLLKITFKLFHVRDITSSFRLMHAEAARSIASKCKYMRESFWSEFTVRALYAGISICEVPIRHRRRPKGETTVYKPWKIPKIAFSQLIGLLRLFVELHFKGEK